MNYVTKICLTIAVMAFFSSLAQVAFSQPPANPIISPELHADRTVTFRLLAPNAKEVQVSGEFSAKPLSMTKDEKGIWSVTTEPLEPNTYGYNFIMDGLSMPDPNNTHIRVGISGLRPRWMCQEKSPPSSRRRTYRTGNCTGIGIIRKP